MKKFVALSLVFILVINLYGCVKTDAEPTQTTDPIQITTIASSTRPTPDYTIASSTRPMPDYTIGSIVVDSFSNWKDPAIFYGYNTVTHKELLVITTVPSPQDEYAARIACLEVRFRGLEGFKYALCSSFFGIVLAYQEINAPDAIYLHNAARTGTGTEHQYLNGERINLSNHGANLSVIQYYLGYMFHDSPSIYEHEIWNRLSSGSSIFLKGNMALEESSILQNSKQVYERVLRENGLGDILAILEP